MKIFSSKLDKIQSTIEKVRSKTPDKYNQQKTLQYLTDDNYSIFIEISNRSDGKSYSFMKQLLTLAVKHDVVSLLIVRHYTLRERYLEDIEKVIMIDYPNINVDTKFNNEYLEIWDVDQNKLLFIVSELPNATDLKNYSSHISQCSIILFDEFIVENFEYYTSEYNHLKTIYESIWREDPRRKFEKPKIILLGNALNLASPLLAGFNLFEEIENATINDLILNKEKQAVIHVSRNDHVNEQKTGSPFDTEHNRMMYTQFDFNTYITEQPQQPNIKVVVNYDDIFINIYKNTYETSDNTFTDKYILDVRYSASSFDYCNKIGSIREKTKILPNKFINPEFYERNIKLIENNTLCFANTFSASVLDERQQLLDISFMKVFESCSDEIIEMRKEEALRKMTEEDFIKRSSSLLSKYYEG